MSALNRFAGRSVDTSAFRRACDKAYDLCDGSLVAVVERFDEGTEVAPEHHELAGEELGRLYIVDEAGMAELDAEGAEYQVLESYGVEAELLGGGEVA